MSKNDQTAPETLSWQAHMEALVVGAVRGMAEAHAALEHATAGMLPPLNDLTMFQAAEVMTAMLLEASPECEQESSFAEAASLVGRDMYAHIKAFRVQHEKRGEPTLLKIIDQAGLERQQPS